LIGYFPTNQKRFYSQNNKRRKRRRSKAYKSRSLIEEDVSFPEYKAHLWAIFNFVMGSPEDKVKLFDDDPKTPPPTTVVDENEEDANFCQLTCVSLTFLVIFGVFFALVVFPSPHQDKDSYNEQGLFVSQNSFFSFHLPLTAHT